MYCVIAYKLGFVWMLPLVYESFRNLSPFSDDGVVIWWVWWWGWWGWWGLINFEIGIDREVSTSFSISFSFPTPQILINSSVISCEYIDQICVQILHSSSHETILQSLFLYNYRTLHHEFRNLGLSKFFWS